MWLKKLVSVCMLLIMSIALFPTASAYTDVKITKNGQVVDTFAGVDAIYATLSSYSNVDTNTTYSCAAFLKKFCSKLWGVTIYNINTVDAAPTVSKPGHTVALKTVSTPRPGDIMQTKNYGHVAVVKAVSGANAILIEQNWSYNSGGYRYARKERSVPISSVYFYRMIIDGNEAEIPGIKVPAVPAITKVVGNGSNVTVTWNSVADADRYVIDFWDPQSGHNYFAVAGTSITKTLPDGQYGIRISAENSAGPSGYSYFTYIWVSKSTVPEIPEITSISVNGSNVTVTWDKTDITSFYVVDFWDVDGAHHFFSTADTSITKTLADGQYGIRIAAENTAGSSGNSYFGDNYIYVGKIHAAFDANGGTLDSSVKAKTSFHSINGIRGEDQLVIFTTPGSSTGTNAYGVEVLVDSTQKVVEIIDRVGNATVPPGGFILSGNREKQYWLAENIEVGDYISYHDNVSEVWVFTKNKWLTVTKKVEWHKPYGELPVPLPREGYRFDGWYTAAEGGTRIDSNSIVDITVDAQTLYAHWVKETYSISYNTNGSGAVIDSTTEKIGTNAKITETIPVREGYRFLGWAASETAASPEYQPGDVYTANTDITLYAVWEERPRVSADITSRPDFDLIDVKLYHLDIGCTVVLAAYKDEKLVDVQYKKYNGDLLSYVENTAYDHAKIIVLDGFNTLTPLCDAEEIIK